MSFFKQLIFNSIPKPSSVDFPVLEMKYWIEHIPDGSKFMVRCPICERVYCYAHMKESNVQGILDGIEDNEAFFIKDWELNCPQYSIHNELQNLRRTYES